MNSYFSGEPVKTSQIEVINHLGSFELLLNAFHMHIIVYYIHCIININFLNPKPLSQLLFFCLLFNEIDEY